MKSLKGPADGAVGVVSFILAIAAGIACAMGGFLAASVVSMTGMAAQPTVTAGPNGTFAPDYSGQSFSKVIEVVVILLLVLVCILFFACAVGIFRGRPWGFRIGVVLYSLLMLGGSGPAALGLAGAVYCVLRLQNLLGSTAAPPVSEG